MSNEKKTQLNDFMVKKFNTDIGQKATVQRHSLQNELSAVSNAKLKDIGGDLNPLAESLTYMGSAAVHIYQSEILGQIFILSQTQTLDRADENLASKAISDLRESMKEHYGRNRQTLRSGF